MENNEYRFYHNDDQGYPGGYGGYSDLNRVNPLEDDPRNKRTKGRARKTVAVVLACAVAGGAAGIGGAAFYNEFLAAKPESTDS